MGYANTKFKVGDKVRIIRQVPKDCTHNAKIGSTAEITATLDSDGHYRCVYERKDGRTERGWITEGSIEAIETPSHNEQYVLTRLFDAEAQIDELQRKVKALEAQLADKPTTVYNVNTTVTSDKVDVAKFTEELRKRFDAYLQSNKTPNQRRANVIKQAQEFVTDLLTEIDGQIGWGRTAIPLYKKCGRLRIEFVVNSEKRTVVALARYGNIPENTEVLGKGIAKCAPDDVFNADIGKAIALARALGVRVPAEFLSATKPTEVVVGMRVKGDEIDGYYTRHKTFTLTAPYRGGAFYYAEDEDDDDWIEAEDIGAILDDTEAQY